MRRVVIHLLIGVAVWMVAAPVQAHAQCRDDEALVGEDADFWYCAPLPTSKDVRRVAEKLDTLRPEWFGEHWRFRKALIDVAGCLARRGTPYVWGGRYPFPQECVGLSGVGLDCSGLVAYASQYAACFVNRFYSAAFGVLRGLQERSASGQAEFFKKHNAWIPPSGSPTPGDAMFFRDTYAGCTGICHVAIYLGDANDGRRLMIHASLSKGVVITAMPEQWRQKLAGYGNSSLLYLKVSGRDSRRE